MHIDGTYPDGTLNPPADGYVVKTPWYVFDPDKQDWVSGPHRCWWSAAVAKRRLEGLES